MEHQKSTTWIGAVLLTPLRNLIKWILVDRFHFCHVRNKLTGKTTLHAGPSRVWPGLFGEIIGGIQEKILVPEGHWLRINNPWDPDRKDIVEGERAIRRGPLLIALHPGERLDPAGVEPDIILTDDDALLVQSLKDGTPHPINPEEFLPAGQEVLIRGFLRFVPHKDIRIVEERMSISLSHEDGKFVQNDDTGQVRLVKGETDLFLEQNESFWDKTLTEDELEALGFKHQKVGSEVRVLAASPRQRRDASDAVVVDLEQHQAICLHQGNASRVVFGPDLVFLEPHERPRILHLSGGVPVRPNVLKTAILDLGPDFVEHELKNVTTSDNAPLNVKVTFCWQFDVDQREPERLFSLKDPIGFAVEVLSAEIREVAASHSLEIFKAQATKLVREALLTDAGRRRFRENGFVVTGIGVDSVASEDPEIQKKLSEALKANVDVFTHRVREEAQLESERRLIDGRTKNEEARKALLALQVENERFSKLEAARTQSLTKRELAKAKAEAVEITTTAETNAEIGRLKQLTEVLDSTGGRQFIELERAQGFKRTDKIVVPTDSKLVLGCHNGLLDD